MPQVLGPALESFTAFTSGVLDKIFELRESGDLEAWGAKLKTAFDTKVKPILDYLLVGTIDPNNPIVMIIQLAKDIARMGLEDTLKTWPNTIRNLTGIDVGPLIQFVGKFKDLVGYLKEGHGLLSDPVLANLGMMFGLEEDALPNLKAKITDTIKGIIATIRNILQTPGFAADFFGNLLGIDPSTIQMVINQVRQSVLHFKEDMGRIWASIKEAAGPFMEFIRNVFLPAWGAVLAMFGKIGTFIMPLITGIIAHIAEFFADNMEWFTEVAGNIYKIVIGFVAGITAFIGFIAPIIEGIVGFVLKLVSAIIAFLQGDMEKADRLGREAFQKLWDGVTEGFMNLVGFLAELWTQYLKPIFLEWLDKALAFGADLIVSIATGFADAVGTVGSLIGQGVQGLIDLVTGKLGIESPSKVFMEMGAQSMAGFIAGFKPNTMISAGLSMGAVPAMKSMGGAGQTVVINNNYHGLTLNDRLEAETLLRPIIQRVVR
jgi:phage-related protein